MREHQRAQIAEEPFVTTKPPRVGEFRVRDGPSFVYHGGFATDYVLSEQFDFGFAITVNPFVAAVFTGSIDHTEHFDIGVRCVHASAGRAVEPDGHNVIAMRFEQSRDDRINDHKPLIARERTRSPGESRRRFVGHYLRTFGINFFSIESARDLFRRVAEDVEDDRRHAQAIVGLVDCAHLGERVIARQRQRRDAIE